MKTQFSKVLFLGMALFFGGAAQALSVGDTAPCVVLEHIETDNSRSTGCIRDVIDEDHGYTLLEFFSVFCSACAENLPILSDLHEEISDTTTVRLVSVDRRESHVENYVDGHNDLINFPVALDSERDAKRAYDVFTTPTVFILNRDNVVVYKHRGVFSDADLREIRSIVSQ